MELFVEASGFCCLSYSASKVFSRTSKFYPNVRLPGLGHLAIRDCFEACTFWEKRGRKEGEEPRAGVHVETQASPPSQSLWQECAGCSHCEGQMAFQLCFFLTRNRVFHFIIQSCRKYCTFAISSPRKIILQTK